MRIAIIGGTGSEGSGLVLRLARAGEEVVIGSRDRQKALAAAAQMNRMAGVKTIKGAENSEAAALSEIVVLTVPEKVHRDMLLALRSSLRGKLLIDATVRLDREAPDSTGHLSAAEEAQQLLGPETKVVAAFQNISAHALRDIDRPIESDVLVVGDDKDAKRKAMALVEKIGARAVDAGGLKNARILEDLTKLLIAINQRYKSKDAGIKVTGI